MGEADSPAPNRRTLALVGNDIVDIRSTENLAQSSHPRLVQRVLSQTEQIVLSSSAKHDLVFLAMWAAKEAAYKLLKKEQPELIFAHSKFVVEGAEKTPDSKGTNCGAVTHSSGAVLCVTWEITRGWIHCIARRLDNPTKYRALVRTLDAELISGEFTERELISVYSDQSRAVRTLAKIMLRREGLIAPEIVRHPQQKRYSPPYIYDRGKRIYTCDLSLSHDGTHMAVVLASE